MRLPVTLVLLTLGRFIRLLKFWPTLLILQRHVLYPFVYIAMMDKDNYRGLFLQNVIKIKFLYVFFKLFFENFVKISIYMVA